MDSDDSAGPDPASEIAPHSEPKQLLKEVFWSRRFLIAALTGLGAIATLVFTPPTPPTSAVDPEVIAKLSDIQLALREAKTALETQKGQTFDLIFSNTDVIARTVKAISAEPDNPKLVFAVQDAATTIQQTAKTIQVTQVKSLDDIERDLNSIQQLLIQEPDKSSLLDLLTSPAWAANPRARTSAYSVPDYLRVGFAIISFLGALGYGATCLWIICLHKDKSLRPWAQKELKGIVSFFTGMFVSIIGLAGR